MGNIGLLKRALPFFATFALGLFVASFFVNIGGQRFGYRNHERGRCRHELQQLREENMRLREEMDSIREYTVHPPVFFENEDMESLTVDEPVLHPPPKPVKPPYVRVK